MPYTTAGLPFQSQSETSREAAIRAEKFVGKQGESVYEWILASWVRGATQKEVSAALSIGRPSCAARFRALELAMRIGKTKERRDGCAVYVVTP